MIDVNDPVMILEKYNNLNVIPEIESHRIMQIGTGGHSMWERCWHYIALPPQADMIGKESTYLENHGLESKSAYRAMAFVYMIASNYEGTKKYQLDAYSESNEGKEQAKTMKERMLALLQEPDDECPENNLSDEELENLSQLFNEKLINKNTVITEYAKRHPEHWQTRYNLIERFCNDAFQTGMHIAYIGIAFDNEDTLTTGIRIMEESNNYVDIMLNDDEKTNYLLSKLSNYDTWPSDGVNPEQYSQKRIDYIKEIINTFDINITEYDIWGKEFLAHTIITHDRLKISYHISEYEHDLGAKDGGLATAMRGISDNLFSKESSLITTRAVKALYELNNNELKSIYREIGKMQLAMIAAGYVSCRFNYGRNESYEVYAISDSIDSDLDYLRKIIDQRITKQLNTDKVYLHVQARMTKNLITPGRLEKCIELAQSDHMWKAFLNQEIRFRPYG